MRENKQSRNILKNVFHETFEIGILIKFLNGLLETLGGFLLLFISAASINRIVIFLTQEELSEDPKDIIANYLIKASESISVNTQLFGSLYLILHGIVKIILVIAVWKRKLWAYPIMIVFLIVFIIYQIYRISYDYSLGLLLLTVLDGIIVFLTAWEYKSIRETLKN